MSQAETVIKDGESEDGEETLVFKMSVQGVIYEVNEAVSELGGYSEKDLIGQSYESIWHSHVPQVAVSDLWHTIKKQQPWTYVIQHKHKKDGDFWLKSHVLPDFKNGRHVGYVAMGEPASQDEIAAAEKHYADVQEGRESWRAKRRFGNLRQFFRDLSLGKKITVVMLLLAISVVLSAALLWVQFNQIRIGWQEYHTQVEERQQLISTVRKQLGYGGVVYHSREYLLHQKKDSASQALQDYRLLNRTLARYRTFSELSLVEEEALNSVVTVARKYHDALQLVIESKDHASDSKLMDVSDNQAIDALAVLEQSIRKFKNNATKKLGESVAQAMWISLVLPLCGLLMLFAIRFALMMYMVAPMRVMVGYFRRITEGFFDNDILVESNDEIGQLQANLKTMQHRLYYELTSARKLAEKSQRIHVALDNTAEAFVMADKNFRLIYENKAFSAIFQGHTELFSVMMPAVNPNDMKGIVLDLLHGSQAADIRQSLEETGRYRGLLRMRELTFKLAADVVNSARGECLGYVVQWVDLTAHKQAEAQVDGLITAAVHGNLNNRLPSHSYYGFMKEISEGFNALLDAVQEPVSELVTVLPKLAEGDLSTQVSGVYTGDFEVLKIAYNQSVKNLRELLIQVVDVSEKIQSGVDDITSGNEDLLRRTHDQAKSLEITSGNMNTMIETVQDNAKYASEASELSIDVRTEAEDCAQVVDQAIIAMDSIRESSHKISDIIGMIDSIAFQTNLLALNAAVEAARAGEQGKGFAVVAGEVRTLAQRAAEAAKDIRELIEDSVKRVEQGGTLVNRSGEVLSTIVSMISRVSGMIKEVGMATQSQSQGINQVNNVVSQLEQDNHQNTLLVDSVTTTSRDLHAQVLLLGDVIKTFDVGSND
jgi:methyl-accepting chemotaxis protein